MKRIFLFFIALVVFKLSFCQEYMIFGNAATYTGDTLKMYTYSDNITKTKTLISKTYVGENGDFSFPLKGKDTIPAFIDLDVFVGIIIIEPNKDLEIVLPKKKIRHEQDRLNPYFKPFKFYVRVINNEKSITSGIKLFDKLYNKSLEKTIRPNRNINSGLIENEILKINDSTSHFTSSYFKNYKKYKFLYYRHLSFYKNKKAIVRKDFSTKKLLINNTAYNKMFDEVFGNFIFETQGNTLYKYLSSNYGWNAYMIFLKKDEIYNNKEFREYILLLNLYKLFYANKYYQRSIIKLLHSANSSTLSIQAKTIVNNFLKKTSGLIIGNPVANFLLPDENGFETSQDDFTGNFVYLNFYNKDSYACKKEIDLLSKLNKKEIEYLKIVTIYTGADSNYLKDLKEKNNYNWVFLQCNTSDKTLNDYSVITYPTYYLISPNGTLLLMPAPGPSKNFEAAFFKIYQEWKRKKIRKGY